MWSICVDVHLPLTRLSPFLLELIPESGPNSPACFQIVVLSWPRRIRQSALGMVAVSDYSPLDSAIYDEHSNSDANLWQWEPLKNNFAIWGSSHRKLSARTFRRNRTTRQSRRTRRAHRFQAVQSSASEKSTFLIGDFAASVSAYADGAAIWSNRKYVRCSIRCCNRHPARILGEADILNLKKCYATLALHPKIQNVLPWRSYSLDAKCTNDEQRPKPETMDEAELRISWTVARRFRIPAIRKSCCWIWAQPLVLPRWQRNEPRRPRLHQRSRVWTSKKETF